MNKKKLIILISVLIALAVLVCVGIFVLSGNKASQIADKLDLGEKYLEDLEYKKALAVYKEVLEIDPKNVEAYAGIVDSYIAKGDYDKALKYAEEGYEETESRKLEKKIEEVESLINDEQYLPASTEKPSGDEAAPSEPASAPTLEPTPEPTPEPTTVPTPEPTSTPLPDNYVIDWIDPNLEDAMREVTGIYDRDIMYSDVKDVTELDLCEGNINDISALSNLTNLTELYLTMNEISDLNALSNLTNLKYLDLGQNNIRDINALSDLTNLMVLYLDYNQISDISALTNLANLMVLDLGENSISDISALSNLTSLMELDLNDNNISDISMLSGMMNLVYLNLHNNPITDYSPVDHVPNVGKNGY